MLKHPLSCFRHKSGRHKFNTFPQYLNPKVLEGNTQSKHSECLRSFISLINTVASSIQKIPILQFPYVFKISMNYLIVCGSIPDDWDKTVKRMMSDLQAYTTLDN